MLAAVITKWEELQAAELPECRLDLLGRPRPLPVPWIATCRRNEGVSEQTRLSLLEEALILGASWCDPEADVDPTWLKIQAERFPHVKWIFSHHDFEKTPDLPELLERLKNPYASLYKIAVTAQNSADMLRLMLFAQTRKEPLSAISMGEYGRPSRVLAKVMGAQLHYAGLEDNAVLGRYSLKTLEEVFRFSRLNRETQIYALLGDPVEQSIGHLFHNARFDRNAVYVKIRVSKEELAECFSLIRQIGFAGLSITMPLKEAIVPLLDEAEFTAINTVVFQEGRALGYNTDGAGALAALGEIQGQRIAILGAGGTAKAIAWEAQKRGVVAEMYHRKAPDADYDILINTVPVEIDVQVKKGCTAMDVVYSPKETPFLQRAKLLDCRCVYGEEMFMNQALMQQQMWREHSAKFPIR